MHTMSAKVRPEALSQAWKTMLTPPLLCSSLRSSKSSTRLRACMCVWGEVVRSAYEGGGPAPPESGWGRSRDTLVVGTHHTDLRRRAEGQLGETASVTLRAGKGERPVSNALALRPDAVARGLPTWCHLGLLLGAQTLSSTLALP